MRAWLDKNRTAIDYRVAVLTGGAIFGGDLVIGHAPLRQHGTNTNFIAVGIGWTMLFHDVAAEARSIVDTEYASNAADDATDGATNDGANRAGGPLAFACTTLNASGDTLSLSNNRKSHHGNDGSGSKKTTDHDDLQF